MVVATRVVDFRKGHRGLAAVVEHEHGLDPYSGVAVVFRPKRMDRVQGAVSVAGRVEATRLCLLGRSVDEIGRVCPRVTLYPSGLLQRGLGYLRVRYRNGHGLSRYRLRRAGVRSLPRSGLPPRAGPGCSNPRRMLCNPAAVRKWHVSRVGDGAVTGGPGSEICRSTQAGLVTGPCDGISPECACIRRPAWTRFVAGGDRLMEGDSQLASMHRRREQRSPAWRIMAAMHRCVP